MATLPQAIAAIQAVLAAIPGVTSVPSNPPEQPDMTALPVIYSYPLSGGWAVETAQGDGTSGPVITATHTVAVNLWIARKDLPLDSAQAATLAALVPNALMAAWFTGKFGGTVERIGRLGDAGDSLRYTFDAFRWGGLDLVGYQFQLDVTLEEGITG